MSSDRASASAQAVAGGVVALVFSSLGPPGALAAGFGSPLVAAALDHAVHEWRRHGTRRTELLLNAASADAHSDLNQLLARICDDPYKLNLFAQSVEAATRTASEAKILLLGRALASGALASDSAVIDDAHLRTAVLAELDAPHVRVLERIAKATRRQGSDWRGASEATIAGTLPGSEDARVAGVLQLILRTLDRNGLIHQTALGELWEESLSGDNSEDLTNEWAATDFGRTILDDFLEAGRAAEPETRAPD